MSTAKKLASHYTRLTSLWPSDALRPTNTFHSVLEKRLAQLSSRQSSNPPTSPTSTTSPSPAQATAVSSLKPANGTAPELVQINALYSLVENRYAKKYRLSDAYMKPSANPEYYNDLMAELEAAPNRSRLQTWLASWKGYLRWS